MRVRVLVRLKPGIMDVQGTAIGKALAGLGFADAGDLRVGKVIELDVPGGDLASIRPRVDEMCRKLLVNPVLEDWTVEAASDLAAPRGGR
jgi:phosphoribosylformylglycinamidine synthase PurS subunit